MYRTNYKLESQIYQTLYSIYIVFNNLSLFKCGAEEMLLVDCLSWFQVSTMLVYVFTLDTTHDGDSGMGK